MMEMLLTGLAVFTAAYLACSLPTAYLLTRLVKGVDIRMVGSRNPATVNVFREVAPSAEVAVLRWTRSREWWSCWPSWD